MMPRFEEHLNEVYVHTVGGFLASLECLVEHGAGDYARQWGADTVEDYLHLMATDGAIEEQAEVLTSDPSMRPIVAETLRGMVRMMAHVASIQDMPKVHD